MSGESETSVSFRTCPLCEATCGLQVEVADGAVTRIRGDMDDVFSKGYICPKGSSLKGLHDDPDRLRSPLEKQPDGSFVPISWERAWQLIDDRLPPMISGYGKESVAIYSGNPWSHNYEAISYTSLLYGAVGNNRYAAASIDQRPREIMSGLHFGARTAFPVPDIDRTDLLVLLGSDPIESNGSLATAPDWPGRLQAILDRGGRIVVVDPRRTKTAELAGEHLAIIPGSDAALLAGIANTLFAEGLADPGPVGEWIDGLDEVRTALEPFTPEAVATSCGIAAEQIRRLAHDLAAAPSAVVHGRIGTCLQDKATLSSWLLDIVNTLTGNLDRPGGAMFSKAAAMGANTSGPPGIGRGVDYNTFQSRVRGLPGAYNQLPVVALAEEIETPGDGQVRALITVAGNPVLSAPDSARLAAAFDSLEFMVSIDMYLNETTRHADVVLPAPSALERSHYDVSYYGFSVRNIANYSPAVLPLADDMWPEWRVFVCLARVLAGDGPSPDIDAVDHVMVTHLVGRAVGDQHSPIHDRDPDEILSMLAPRTGPQRLLDFNLRVGPYGDAFGRVPGGLTLDELEANPHGIDLGALQPRIPEMLRTTNGRIDMAHPALIDDVERLRHELDAERPDLVLIGRRHLRSNNSWQHNVRTLMKGKDRCVLLVHPSDADRFGVVDGGQAVITSDVDSITAPVQISDDVMPGVISLPHGWGHDLPGVQMALASERPGVNVNLLGSNEHIDPLSGNPHLNGIRVRIAPAVTT